MKQTIITSSCFLPANQLANAVLSSVLKTRIAHALAKLLVPPVHVFFYAVLNISHTDNYYIPGSPSETVCFKPVTYQAQSATPYSIYPRTAYSKNIE